MEAVLHDGRRLEFPDGTSPEVVQATVRRVLGQAAPSADRDPMASAMSALRGNPSQEATEAARRFSLGAAYGLREPIDAGAQMLARAFGSPESVQNVEAINRAAREKFETGGPEAETGRMVGGAVSTLPLMAMPGLASARFAPRLAASTGTGAAIGAGTPVEGDDFWRQKAQQAGIGAALGAGGQAAITGVSKAISPIANRLNPEQARLAQTFEGEIAPLTPGQATGSRPLTMIESVLGNAPGSSAGQSAILQKQREGFTQAVLARAGIDAKEASPSVLADARAKFRAEYTDLSKNTGVMLGPEFERDLADVAARYTNSLKADQKSVFLKKVEELQDLAAPQLGMRTILDGEKYQNIRTKLNEQIAGYKTSDPFLATALGNLKTALNEADKRSTPAALQGVRAELDKRYTAFKTIQDAMEKSTSGEIPPLALFNAAAKRARGGAWTEGRGDLNDLARAGREFLRTPPDSGTAQRAAALALIQGGGGATAGGYYSGGDLGAMGAGMGAALAGPAAVQRLMSSRAGQAYLRNQVANPGMLSRGLPPALGLLDLGR